MMARAFSGILIAAGLGLAGAAYAQEGLSTKPNYDLTYTANRIDDDADIGLAQLRQEGLTALQAKDYVAAETALTELLRRRPSAVGANFLLGLSKIGLEKWEEARPVLELAVRDEPKRPEPKTRLGLTYVMLKNADAAKVQREALADLNAECNNTCKDATWIADGIKAIDQALAAGAGARVSGASLAAVAIAPPKQPGTFDPSVYSLVEFNNTSDLYDLLTAEGRCVPNKTAEPRQPCALILYRPTDDKAEGLAANFKPVFKVINRKSVWAIHDKKLQKIDIEELYFDNDQIIGHKPTTYMSVALIGNAENTANCAQSRPCLGHLVAEDMFRMYRNMPDSVVEVIWGASGMKDSGTVRIR